MGDFLARHSCNYLPWRNFPFIEGVFVLNAEWLWQTSSPEETISFFIVIGLYFQIVRFIYAY